MKKLPLVHVIKLCHVIRFIPTTLYDSCQAIIFDFECRYIDNRTWLRQVTTNDVACKLFFITV